MVRFAAYAWADVDVYFSYSEIVPVEAFEKIFKPFCLQLERCGWAGEYTAVERFCGTFKESRAQSISF